MSLSNELDYSKPTLARHVIVLQPVDVEDLGEILDAEVTEDGHDHSGLLRGMLRKDLDVLDTDLQLVSDLNGGPGVEASAAPDHQTLLASQLVTDVEGVLVLHLDHVVNQREVHAARNRTLTDTLNQKLLRLYQLLRDEELVENGSVWIREDTLDVGVL